MRKVLFLLFVILASGALFAQTPGSADNKIFEEAMARDEEPATKAYVIPQIADLQMLSEAREVFGPYKFKLQRSGTITEGELANAKGRALYRATMEADADLLIGSLFDSYVLDNDDRYVVVELSGYPAKFVNWRPIPLDVNMQSMINICYPASSSQIK